jgi:hypothetical protein
MRLKISITEECEQVIFPINTIKIILIITCCILIIGSISLWSIDFTNDFNFIFLEILAGILVIIFIPLLTIVIIFSYYKIYNFFNRFGGKFEKGMAKGFLLIIISIIMSLIFFNIYRISNVYLIRYLLENYQYDMQLYVLRLIDLIHIIFILIGLLGIYHIITSLDYYQIENKTQKNYFFKEGPLSEKMSKYPFQHMDVIKIIIIIIGSLNPGIPILLFALGIYDVAQLTFTHTLFLSFYLVIYSTIIIYLLFIIENTYRYQISRFFGKFKGEFEKRFSYGFMIIVIGTLLQWLTSFSSRLTPTLFFHFYYPGYPVQDYMIILYIIYIFNFIIKLFILYGILVLVSSLKFYRPLKKKSIFTKNIRINKHQKLRNYNQSVTIKRSKYF